MSMRQLKMVVAGLLIAGHVLFAVQPAAAASTLYGLSSDDPGQLFTIDTTSGAATFVTDVSHSVSLTGLASRNGTLYASDVFDGNFSFGTINRVTGAFSAINTQGGSSNWHGLAYRPSTDVFYAFDQDSTNLVSITPGGAISDIGSNTGVFQGLAYDPVNEILYASDAGGLFTLNTSTAASSFIGSHGTVSSGPIGLEYDSLTSRLYMNDNNSLYLVSTSDGVATLIGSNGYAGAGFIDGLAFVNVAAIPEPSTYALMLAGLGFVGFVANRRRKAQTALA